MAGFRNRRGRDRGAHPGHGDPQQGGYPPPYPQTPQHPYGQQTYPGPERPPYAQQHGAGYPAPAAPTGEPEYFGGPAPAPSYAPAASYDDSPGHTRAFSIDEPPYGAPRQGTDAYGGYPGGDQGDHVATYRAGQTTGPPAGPRLHWKQLISGIVLRPGQTFWQMRDYQVWAPALLVTFVYGLLAVFGFDKARADILNATLSNSIPWVISTAVAVVLSGLMLGAVTNALARQFGGDGAWAPTIGLAMLITTLTDAPRLFFALFLGGANGFVQILGWATWLACAALMTSMVSKSHDLPWPKALGASSIQLVALLVLFKLPVI